MKQFLKYLLTAAIAFSFCALALGKADPALPATTPDIMVKVEAPTTTTTKIPPKVNYLPTTTTTTEPTHEDPIAPPPGLFQTPCAEDEIPTIVDDSDRELPPGVWYICIHRDQYGEVMDSGWYLWDMKAGHLINE